MISTLMKFLQSPATVDQDASAARQAQVAVAAILVEAARRDGDYDPRERATIDDVLQEAYALDAAAAATLRGEGEAAQAEAVDVHRFTRIIKDNVPYEERGQMLERVWRVVLADDVRHDAENAFMRKLAGLLYVEPVDSAAARQRAMRD